jgi:hypothetical protein
MEPMVRADTGDIETTVRGVGPYMVRKPAPKFRIRVDISGRGLAGMAFEPEGDVLNAQMIRRYFYHKIFQTLWAGSETFAVSLQEYATNS